MRGGPAGGPPLPRAYASGGTVPSSGARPTPTSRVSAMPAALIDGKSLALEVRAQVAEDVRAFGQPVCLATILVGDDPASHVYVGSKHEASHEAGIESRDHRFPADTPESEILDLLGELNADEGVGGVP